MVNMAYSYSFSDGIDGTALLKEHCFIIGSHWKCNHSWTAHDKNEAESNIEIYYLPFRYLSCLSPQNSISYAATIMLDT